MASVEGYQPGQPGLIQTTIDPENDSQEVDFDDRLEDTHPRIDNVTTTFEYHYKKGNKFSARMNGFFKAPETGRYRFHLSADHESWLWLDN